MRKRFFSDTHLQLKQNKMLVQMVLSYFLVSTLLILALSILMTHRFVAKSEQDYIDSYTEIIGRISDSMNLIFSETYQSAEDFLKNDGIFANAISGHSFTADEIIRIRERMVDFLIQHSFVASIYLVNKEADTVFSTYPYQCSKAEFYDQEALQLLATQQSRTICSRHTPISVDGEKLPSDYITLLYPISGEQPTNESGMVININSQMLRVYLDSAYLQNVDLFISDADGAIVFASGDSDLSDAALDADILEAIAQQERPTGHFSFQGQGNTCQVIYQQGDSFGLTYIGLVPQTLIWENLRLVIRWIVLLTLLLVLTGLLIAYHYILKIYAPVYQLVEKVRDHQAEEAAGQDSELEYLFQSYDSLFQDIRHLSSKARQQCLYKILNESYESKKAMEKDLEACGISLAYPAFLVFYLRFSRYDRRDADYGQEIARVQAGLLENGVGIFGPDVNYQGVVMDMSSVALILFGEGSLLERREAYCKALCEFIEIVKNRYGIRILAGIGLPVTSAAGLGEGYTQAAFAASCEMYRPPKENQPRVIHYQEVQGLKEVIVDYPLEIEKKILSALKKLDLESARQALVEFLELLQHGAPEIAQLYLLQLCVPLAEFLSDMDRTSMDFYHIRKKLELCETLYEEGNILQELFEEYVSLKKEERQQKEARIVRQTMEWICEHYQDAGLTLDSIAEAEGCSSSYLRRIFKDAAQISPTDYLMQYRIEQAKEKLVHTADTSAKIASQVGMANTKYFYSVFKKMTGYTTSEYRKHFGKAEEEYGEDKKD